MAKSKLQELRDKVMNTDDIQYDEVYVEEWDVTLPVKTLSSAEMKDVMEYKDEHVRMMILAVLLGCKDESGEAVFQREDLAVFETKKAFSPIMTVAEKVLDLSGFSDKAVEDAKNS